MEKSIYSPKQEVLLRLLREVRQEAGVTQVDLAAKLGTQQAMVSNYERGERRLDLIELQQVCEALGITVSEFVIRFEKATLA